MVSVADLLLKVGMATSEGHAWSLICHGRVKIEEWTLSIQEGTLPRWVLRGTTLTVGDRSIRIADDGFHMNRMEARQGTLV